MIRKAIEADVIKVSRLWLEMVKELNSNYEPRIDWWREQTRFLICNNKDYKLFVADDGGKIIGFIDFLLQLESARGKRCVFARHFYIKPEYRYKKRIAKELYETGIISGKEWKANLYMFLCQENEKEMWIKQGYSPGEIIMEKSL